MWNVNILLENVKHNLLLCLKPNLSCPMLNNFDCREVTLKHSKSSAEGLLERSASFFCCSIYRTFNCKKIILSLVNAIKVFCFWPVRACVLRACVIIH